jgi:hypothetical protein
LLGRGGGFDKGFCAGNHAISVAKGCYKEAETQYRLAQNAEIQGLHVEDARHDAGHADGDRH